MTNKEIKAIITDYITDDRYRQAVLIDGAWGCGKTFFVTKKLKQHINETLAQKDTIKKAKTLPYIFLCMG